MKRVQESLDFDTKYQALYSQYDNLSDTLWDMPVFNSFLERQKHNDDLIANPIHVVEGAMCCSKCGKYNVLTYQQQTRSADEPMTTFAKCTNKKCRYEWRE